MAKGYAIFLVDVQDAAAYQAYVDKAFPVALGAGLKPLVYGEAVDVREGDWPGNRVLVGEFESVDAAKAWYESAEYQALVPERTAAAPSSALFIEGFEMPSG